MHPSFIPPRQVQIGDAAAFVGTTPRAIRHYEQLGLLPAPERGGDGRRRYGYDDMIRLLWIRKMADAGISLDDIRGAFGGAGSGDSRAAAGVAGAGGGAGAGAGANADAGANARAGASGGTVDGADDAVIGVLHRLDMTLAAREAELTRQRAAVERMRTRGSRLGLLDDFVARRLEHLPEGSLRQSDLDTLLVSERMLSPLGAAMQAGRFILLATRPDLRAESDRVDAAEDALDDTVAVDDPRVAQVAAERHAFEERLLAAIVESGEPDEDFALIDLWDELHPPADDGAAGGAGGAGGVGGAGGAGGSPARADGARRAPRTVMDALGTMPYDFSPARLRCLELSAELMMESPLPPGLR
jgi:DNA-binding transcriptional MerR regulator